MILAASVFLGAVLFRSASSIRGLLFVFGKSFQSVFRSSSKLRLTEVSRGCNKYVSPPGIRIKSMLSWFDISFSKVLLMCPL